jgi:histidinol-phosphate phosphatase family protein
MSAASSPVFLDRDGTLIVEKHYLVDPREVHLEQGVAEGLLILRRQGHPLIVLSNQSGIGRGLFTEADAQRVNARVAELLRSHGVDILAWYICPHVPQALCDCRKPSIGMALAASREWNLQLAGSYVIGDKRTDLELAGAIGAEGLLVTTGHSAGALEWARLGGHRIFDGVRAAAEYIAARDIESAGAPPAAPAEP